MLNAISVDQPRLQPIAHHLELADVALANLEIPLTQVQTPTPHKTAAELRRRDQFILKADPGHAQHLAACGIDLVSLANNHAMDYGEAGLAEMLGELRKHSIRGTGAGMNAAEAYEPAIYVLPNGLKVGLLSALAFINPEALRKCGPSKESEAGVAVLSFQGKIDKAARAKLESWIGRAKEQCDLLVFAAHWGLERQTVPTPYQVQLARALVDAGADVVWGHHPHVLQGAELYKNKPILYSMGNMLSPRSGHTALVRLRFVGSQCVGLEEIPAQIGGGALQEGGARQLGALGKEIAKRYPSADTTPAFP